MARPYSVMVMARDASKSFVIDGFIKCQVSERVHPFRQRVFVFCLHCDKLRSLAWWYSHWKSSSFDLSSERRDFVMRNFERYEGLIVKKIDNLDALGCLFKDPGTRSLIADERHPVVTLGNEMVESPRAGQSLVSAAFDEDEADRPEQDQDGQSPPIVQRTVQCISECFEEFCFLNKTISCERFVSLSRAFFDAKNCSILSTSADSILTKSKVLSHIIRKSLSCFH